MLRNVIATAWDRAVEEKQEHLAQVAAGKSKPHTHIGKVLIVAVEWPAGQRAPSTWYRRLNALRLRPYQPSGVLLWQGVVLVVNSDTLASTVAQFAVDHCGAVQADIYSLGQVAQFKNELLQRLEELDNEYQEADHAETT